jgi:3-methylcrotonyl-CoA carboxylase alpha subunit
MAYTMLLDERDVALDIIGRRPDLLIRHNDANHVVAETKRGAQTQGRGAFELAIDGRVVTGWRYAIGDEVYVRIDGRTFLVGLPQAQLRAHVHSKGDAEIRADMPGTMIAIHGEAGQEVKAGDKLVTIESMKLQVTLVAPRDAVVASFHVPAETAFERGALLVSFVTAEAAAAPAKA